MTATDTAPARVVEPKARSRTANRRLLVLIALIALMIASSVAHLWAFHRDLPLQDVDEHATVRPAVQIAASGHPNPHWFGFPGSTIIYPLATFVHVWDAVAHDGPLIGGNATLLDRYHESPTEFYEMGRLWAIALAVGSIPFVYLIGQRAFNRRVGLMAAALWATLPYPVQLGRVVRTDSAAVFFGLVALWLILRFLDEPRTRWCVVAGVCVGLAVASRYFMAALVPCLLAVAIYTHRRSVRDAARAAGIAVGSTLAGFALSTPYFFLDWRTARHNLNVAAEGPERARASLGYFGNLRWYLGTAIPESLTWPLISLAVAGVMLVFWRRRPAQLLLVAFCGVFLAAMCASKLHWQRWILQILPVVVLFSACAIDAAIRALRGTTARAPWAPVAIAALAVVLLALRPVADLIELNRRDSNPTTRAVARTWIEEHAPPGSRVIATSYAFGAPAETIAPLENNISADYNLDPRARTVSDYQRAGYHYAIVSANDGANVFSEGHTGAFYLDLNCKTKLVARINPSETRGAFAINIFDLTTPPERVRGLFCLQ